jgi:nucleotidyltransferase substrate binding protein (TIGR01987 family)
MSKEIRWKQRFQNFEKALNQLEKAVNAKFLSDLEKEGLIQRFEYTFELAWKTLKDYLESKGNPVQFPRDVVKDGFKANILKNGEAWMEMLEKRNLIAHTYNEENFNYAVKHIRANYFNELVQLYEYLKDEL